MLKFLPQIIFSLAVALIIAPHVSFAYIDPGTGSFIVQAILGVIFGASLTVRIFWRKIIGFFKKVFKINAKTDEQTGNDGQREEISGKL